MRALMLEVPEAWLEERARHGQDRFDEVWEGVLHMVPPPSYEHQDLASELHAFLKLPLRRRGIRTLYETGLFRPGAGGRDYRVPDLIFFDADRPALVTRHGIEGAPRCVLEIRSPDDETYDKLDFYAAVGAAEVVVIEPGTRQVEVHRLVGGRYRIASADRDGFVHASSIDVRFARVEQHGGGAVLRVSSDDAVLEV